MNISIDPDSLRAAGTTITATGVRAAELARRHHDAAPSSAAWGRGATARLGAIHEELVVASGEALDLLAAVLDRGGGGVAGMGEAYAAADGEAGEAGEAFARVASGLP